MFLRHAIDVKECYTNIQLTYKFYNILCEIDTTKRCSKSHSVITFKLHGPITIYLLQLYCN